MDTSSLFISPIDLAARLGRPDAPLLLDVRPPPRFDASDAPAGDGAVLPAGSGGGTDRVSIAPPAAGLLAILLGMARLHPDDHALLAALMPVYDAVYAWCRDGLGETRRWAAHAVPAAA